MFIAKLKGTICEIERKTVIVDVGGVGYEVACSLRCVEKLALNQQATLTVYTEVKEDSIKLYGFEDELEKRVFLMLLRVKGVGAKSASELISQVDKKELLRIISEANPDRLKLVKGIGRKTAERIIVELKDKVIEYSREVLSESYGGELVNRNVWNEAQQALQALGFTRKDAESLADQVRQELSDNGSSDASEIVKMALRYV